MIVGFARHGKGGGAGVVGYIAGGAEAVGYLTGGKKAGKPRDPAPVILRGDPAVARHLIDLVPHEWKYTSGMVSFAKGEKISPEMERRVMDEFEQCAFAGLERHRFYTLWTRHNDGPGKCHHLHFVTPRMDLLTGKSLNIAPPGRASRELFDAFRSKMNAELGLADPDDPARMQAVRLPHHIAKLQARERSSIRTQKDVRTALTRHLEEKARQGLINRRDDIIRYLREAGVAITREGRNYLTVQDEKSGERVRLRGGLYDGTRYGEALARIRGERQDMPLSGPQRLKFLEEKLEHLVAARAQHNQERYGRDGNAAESKERSHDRLGTPFSGGGARDGALVWRAGKDTERAFGDLDQATQRFERAGGGLVSASRQLERGIEWARGERRERELTHRLIERYGGAVSAASLSTGRGFEREREMELV